MKLRNKIFLYFGLFLFLVILGFAALEYFVVEQSLHTSEKKNLQQNVESISTAAETMLNLSIKNYLRSVVDQNMLVLEGLYAKVQQGKISEKEAKNAFQNHIQGQKIGKSGYVVALRQEDSRILLEIHPFMRGQDCSDNLGCQTWIAQKNGYNEYDWKNPEDEKTRKKVGYIRYFEPWNWIVGSTSYKDEFTQLVQIEDLKQLIKPFKILERGYFFVMNDQYEMLIHPRLEGRNILEMKNKDGTNLTKQLMQNQESIFYYRWRSPTDEREEDKFAYIRKLEDFNWYLVASGYVEDIVAPIRKTMYVSYLLIIVVALVLVILTTLFSRSLIRPLKILLEGLKEFETKRKTFKMSVRSVSEIDSVGDAMEYMTHTIVDSEKEKKELLIQLNSIINSMPSILVVVDSNENVILWNEKAADYSGYSSNEAVNQPVSKVLLDFKHDLESLRQYIIEQKSYTKVCKIESVSKPDQFFEIFLYPLPAAMKSAVIRIDDISNRIHIEEALLQSRKMDAVGYLAGGIAHDFNNMLSGIIGSVQILEKRLGDPVKSKKTLKVILDTATRAAGLTHNLLSFSRKNVRKSEPLHVHVAVKEVVSILKRSINKSIEIRLDLQAENDVVDSDPSELQSLFMNLAINSSHAMPEGGVLTFRSQKLSSDKTVLKPMLSENLSEQYIKLEVEDTGVGIPEAIIDKVFDPFFTTKDQGKGTGLGLSSAYGAVMHLNGKISVSSEIGKGSLFSILLPLSDKQPSIQDRELTEEISGSGTILVVEDEELLRDITQETLEDLGYKVLLAANGLEGIEQFQQYHAEIDLVLLDMIMPVMTGHECFQKLKKIDPNVRVIVVSGFSKDEQLNQMQLEGEFAYLRKPYDTATISRVISSILQK